MGIRIREKVRGSDVWWIFVSHEGKRASRKIGEKKTAQQIARLVRTRLKEGQAVAESGIFLEEACKGDTTLRKRMQSLLSVFEGISAPAKGALKSGQDVEKRLAEALQDTYVFQKRIGTGGMGDLYLATHKHLGGKWAIKVLSRDLAGDPSIVDRFVIEAKVEANLQHPNIVKVFHIGEAEGFHYLVMNYVEGEDLATRMLRGGPMQEREAGSIAIQICRALECAHDHNIIHRDLKPSNIRIDNYGTVVVLDFGIARVRDAAMKTKTALGERLGTPLYMSPEQVQGHPIDCRSDFYSLGVLLYEMVTGANPFDAESSHAIYARHLNLEPPSLLQACPGVSRGFSEIVRRLLRKKPEERFQSASEISGELRALSQLTDIRTPAPESVAASAAPATEWVDKDVLRRGPTVLDKRSLSSGKKIILEHVDDARTAREIQDLSSLEKPQFQAALSSLLDQQVVVFGQSNAGGESLAPEAVIRPAFAHSKLSELRARVAALPALRLGAMGAIVVAVGVILFLMWRPGKGDGTPPVPQAQAVGVVRVDASPFAKVQVRDAQGKLSLEEFTPFRANLQPGVYVLEFVYGGEKRDQEVRVLPGKAVMVREVFPSQWDSQGLLEDYLK